MWRQSRRVALTLVTFEGSTQTRSFRLPSVFHKLSWSKFSTLTTTITTLTQDANTVVDNEKNTNLSKNGNYVSKARETNEVAHKHNANTEFLLLNDTNDDKSNIISRKELLLRKGLRDDSYLEEHGVHIEEIAGGVQVINLPCKTKEKTEFDEYMTSTNEYRMRTVSPHSTDSAKVDALGAGFGMLDDKRLSYLRPRDGVSSEMSLQQKEKEKQQFQQAVHDEWGLEEQKEEQSEKSPRGMEKKQMLPSSLTSIQLSDTFAGKMSLFSSFDEHGNPITLTDSSGKPLEGRALRMERFRQQQQLVRSMSGTTFNKHEHPLLIDLDFAKDAHLYGNTREEFERNVRKMKQLISTFQRWESIDNLYRYATIALQLITLFLFTEIVYNYSVLQLLANQYDDFVDVIEGELRELEHVREKDLRHAIHELKSNRPDFKPVIDAMKREKYRCEREEQLAKTAAEKQERNKKVTAKRHRTASDNDTTHKNDVSESSSKSSASIWQWLSQPSQPVMTIHDLLDDTRPHPMDTSRDELHKSKEEQAKTSYEFKRLRQYMINEHDKENSFAHRVKHSAWQWSRFTTQAIQTLCNRLVRTENNVMRRSMQSEMNSKNDSVSDIKSFTSINSEKNERAMKENKDDGDNVQNRKIWLQNVLSADDKERYSYAATPTGIDTMRAVRRILLPRSEDYTQIVREEMVAYQQEKTRRVGKLHESLQIDN